MRFAHWWNRVAITDSMAGKSIQALIYFTIYYTGKRSSILPYFLKPFHFFQFYNHSLNKFNLLVSTLRLSELSERPIFTGTIYSLDYKDSLVLGDLNFKRKRQHRIRCYIGSVYALSADYIGLYEAFITSSIILLTFSKGFP